jgi:hypothetical protein
MNISDKLVAINAEVGSQEDLLDQIIAALDGKAVKPPSVFETWVFTLADGSTVEKEVEVSA